MDISVNMFPSPYGVIFTLTLRDKILMMYVYKFPSPCGVIFILTPLSKFNKMTGRSMCFRLLTELYSFLLTCRSFIEWRLYKVSVSLWSIIHSYFHIFRYGNYEKSRFPSPYGVIFILIRGRHELPVNNYVFEFPSPYGVIFILTKC